MEGEITGPKPSATSDQSLREEQQMDKRIAITGRSKQQQNHVGRGEIVE